MKGLKVSNFDPIRGVLVGTGLTSGGAAGGSVASVTDGTITVTGVHSFVFPTSEVTELASGVAQIVVGLAAGKWEIVMTPGVTGPPEPVWTPDGTDYVYAWVTDA